MSTLAYASLTTTREAAAPGTSITQSPGVGTYIDAFAALVPAEILTLHAVIISIVTETPKNAGPRIISADMPILQITFWALIVLCMCLYVFGRLTSKKWDKLDYLRVLIPPLAFTGWTMLQKLTAFDAAWPGVSEPGRTIIALFLGMVLGLAAVALAYQIDKKLP